MKKLYIPTSTLNFNNILSSESISPIAFYSLRGFGYSRWQVVEENCQENAILLYEKPFSFNRPASDMEDHPMLVEVATDKEFPSLGEGIFYSDETIYLSPWRTRFIFFSEQDRKVALSISDSSLETKMLSLYYRQLHVESYAEMAHRGVSVNIPFNKKAVDFDICINKLKGFLYGYYIGALLSTTPEMVEKANILHEIQNIFSAIVSSDTRMPTALQRQQLMIDFEKLHKYTPVFKYLQSIIKETESVGNVVATLSEFGVVFPSSMQNGESIIQSLKLTNENNSALAWLKREKDNQKKEELEVRKFLSPSSMEIVLTNCALNQIANSYLVDEKEQQLMKVWVNDVFTSNEYNGKVSVFAETLSDVVTKKAKEVYEAAWEDSKAKVELNQMRRYIRAQESLLSWKEGLFSSIAAVLAKGNDWEQLYSFMRSKQISDYRIAFAIFGELNGFANLTRDFTDVLFGLPDRKYVAEVYKDVYRQLIGLDPSLDNAALVEEAEKEDNTESSNECDNVQHKAGDEVDLYVWQQTIKDFAKKQAIKQEKKRLSASLEQALVENGYNTDYSIFLKVLAKYDGWTIQNGRPSAALKRMQDHFVSDNSKKMQRSLFEGGQIPGINPTNSSIITDVNAEKVISECSILPNTLKKQIVEIFREFQKKYQTGHYSNNPIRYPKDNANVIDHFVKWCFFSRNKKAISQSQENSKIMNELKDYLLKIYND